MYIVNVISVIIITPELREMGLVYNAQFKDLIV